jgi:hypothetical protein
LASAAGAAGCEADLGTANCQITQQMTLPGSPLTLLRDVRLDVFGAGTYALLGYDADQNAVRWATLLPAPDGSLTLGAEHAYGLPPGAQDPLFAMAAAPRVAQPPGSGDAVLSGPAPGDTVLIAYVPKMDPGQTAAELDIIAVPEDGSAPAAPPATLLEFPDGPPPASSLAMVSSTKGINAGLAWIDDDMQRVMYAAVDGTGAMVVGPTPAGPGQPGFRHLAFGPGKDQATLVYYSDHVPSNPPGPGWIIAEANESGGVDSFVALPVSREPTSPAVVTPTDAGYAIAWQDSEGSWLRVYAKGMQAGPGPYDFASASSFGGSLIQPPLVALTSFAPDFGVLFQQPRDAELWRLDEMGGRRSGTLIFPSALGELGTVSAVYVPAPGTALVATYADYTGGDAMPGLGDRLVVTATCY